MPSARHALPLLFCSSLFMAAATAATFQSLYSFGIAPDGELPIGAMAVDKNGVLFGATQLGGAHSYGTVFSLTPPASPGGPWTEAILWSFGSPGDGGEPMGGVVLGEGGVLYGTTYSGGTIGPGAGTVFSLTPPDSPGGQWTENLIWSFGAAGGPFTPLALVIGSGGVLYGTASDLFTLTPPATAGGAWTEEIIGYPNGDVIGCNARAPVALASDGTIYGTTNYGANPTCEGVGTVFSLTPTPGGDWTPSLLFAFPSSFADGGYPQGGVIVGAGGVLYGTAIDGGAGGYGTVFSLTPPATVGDPWIETTLYGFSGKDGNWPYTNLWLNKQTGALYGTTEIGGFIGPKPHADGDGTVFELRPPASPGAAWALRQLHHFIGSDGAHPEGSLAERNGVFYGTTFAGGANDKGTVFSVIP